MRDLPNLYYKDGSVWKEFSMTKEPVLLWSGEIGSYEWQNGIQTISVPGITDYNIIVGIGEDDDSDNYVSIPMIKIPDGMPLYSPATVLDGYNHRWSGMGTLYDKRQYQYQGGYGIYMGALAANDNDQVRGAIPYGPGKSTSTAYNCFAKGTSSNAVPISSWNGDPMYPEDFNNRILSLLRIYGIS